MRIADFHAWLASLPPVSTYLSANNMTRAFWYAAVPDTAPDSVWLLIPAPGFGTSLEDGFDRPAVQVVPRGPDYRRAEEMAHVVDAAILDADYPVNLGSIGTRRMLYAKRSGGSPTFLARDDRGRVLFSCSYHCEVSRI